MYWVMCAIFNFLVASYCRIVVLCAKSLNSTVYRELFAMTLSFPPPHCHSLTHSLSLALSLSLSLALSLSLPSPTPSFSLSLTSQTSGIIVLVMLFSSCLCCCSIFSLCCGDFPKAVKIIGALLFIVVCLALSIYVGWIAVGTYFAIEIRSADAVCRNMIIYLVLLYIYLVILALVGVILVVWKCNDVKKRSQSPSEPAAKTGRRAR